jgi:hypothetical protein
MEGSMGTPDGREAGGKRLAAGIEIADGATRYTLTFGGAPEARRWHVRLATPPPPDEAVETIIALVGRALDESGAADQARSPDGRAIALGIAFGDAELDAAGGRVRRRSGWRSGWAGRYAW